MIVQKNIMDKWNAYRAHGDVQKIHEISGLSSTTISNALNSGEMTKETFDAINDFYIERSKDVNSEADKIK